MKFILSGISLILCPVIILFVFAWHDHTNWVQSNVEERFDKFLSLQPNWQTIDPSANLSEYKQIVTVSATILWSVSDDMKNTEYAYKEALYDMLSDISSHNKTPAHDINWHAANIKDALDNMSIATNRFLSNQFYAMWHTF